MITTCQKPGPKVQWRYEASTNLYVGQWLLPTTSLNFTFRCKSWKCPTSKIYFFEFEKNVTSFHMKLFFCSFSEVFCWFEITEKGWKWTKKVENGWKKLCWPAFFLRLLADLWIFIAFIVQSLGQGTHWRMNIYYN